MSIKTDREFTDWFRAFGNSPEFKEISIKALKEKIFEKLKELDEAKRKNSKLVRFLKIKEN